MTQWCFKKNTHVGLFDNIEVLGLRRSCGSLMIMESSDHEGEAVDLLEECWFFDNLLNRRARMLRCFSDPCPSSKFGQDMLAKTSCPDPQDPLKLPDVDDPQSEFRLSELVQGSTSQDLIQPLSRGLLKSPSLPVDFGSEMVVQSRGSRRRTSKSSKQQSPKSSEVLPPRHASKSPYPSCQEDEEEGDFSLSRLIQQPTIQELLLSPSQPPCVGKRELGGGKVNQGTGQPLRRSLLRSPSLPSGFGREEPIQEKESHSRKTKSRQPSPSNSSDVLPPRHASKGMTQCYSIPRHQQPRNTEPETINDDNIKEMRRRYLNHSKSRKNLTDFESQEVQGFKDLGFKFDNQDLNPSVVNILPGLQAKTGHDYESEKGKVVSKPYLSEEWLVQSYGPKIPHWGAKKSPEHMKAQIKFWARAVASNVP